MGDGLRPAVRRLRRAAAVGLSVLLAPAAVAGDVTLTSPDRGFSLTGELLSYTPEIYRIATRYGPLTVAADGVACEGACPDLAAYVPEFRLIGAPALGRVLLPALLEAYGFRHGLGVRRSATGSGAMVVTYTDRGAAEEVARFILTEADPAAARDAVEAGRAEAVLAVGDPEENDGLQSWLLALDAVVPAVSRANPLREIAMSDLQGVLAGQISDWAALGGAPGPIRLHALGPPETDALAGGSSPRAVVRHAEPEGLARAIAGDATALGLARLSRLGPTEPLALVGSCGRRLVASAATLKAEDWPLTVPLLVRVRPGPRPDVADAFLAWATGPDAAAIVERTGLVAPHVAEVPMSQQGIRLANAIAAAGDEVSLADLQAMLRRLDGARRLTPSFRFREGGTELDAQSQGNIALLAEAIGDGTFAGREMLLAGFTDGEGPAAQNRRLALTRAETVRAALFAAIPNGAEGPRAVDVAGFGEALPMACDDTEWGRQVNRRVEVWLR